MSNLASIRRSALAMAGALLAGLPIAAGGKPPTDVPGGEAYQTHFAQVILSTSNGSNFFSPDPIPADRRLVIEFVTVRFLVPHGDTPMFGIQTDLGGRGMDFLIPLTFARTGPLGDEYFATMMVRLYYDGDGASGPAASCSRVIRGSGDASCTVQISGYLIGK